MTSYAILLAICALCTACGTRGMWICAGVLVANFIANEAYVRLSGAYTPWAWFLAVDTVSLIILTMPFTGRVGAVLAATYATQAVMHLGFGISKSGEPYTYWQSLTAMAWLQLLILFSGSMTHGCRRLGDCLRRNFPVVAPAHLARVAQAGRGDDE